MKKLAVLFAASWLLTAGTATFAADAEDIVGFPSAVPHPTNNYLPITPQKNMCQMCHKNATSEERKKGMIPLSHLLEGKLAGERYNCTLCHAPLNSPEGQK